jgi:hypothetical protein
MPRFNALMVAILFGILSLALLISWHKALTLVCVTVPLGLLAGVLQARALAANPGGFRSSETAMDVRRALLSTSAGKLSIVLLWGTGILALVWAVAVNPSNPILIWVAGQASFSLARECCSLPALVRLAGQT